MAQGAHDSTSELAIRLRSALETRNLDAFGTLLAEDVRWVGPEETPETCHSRSDVLNQLAALSGAGVDTTLLEVVPGVDSILVGFRVNRPAPGGARRGRTVYQVMSVRGGRIADIRAFPGRGVAAAHAGVAIDAGRVPMRVRGVTPILNVSDLAGSFD